MPAWVNLNPIEVGRIAVGSKTPFYESTRFEVLESDDRRTTLRCIEANPEAGYALGSIVVLDNDTIVYYDINMQGK